MPFHKVAPEKLSHSVVRQIEELILRGILRPGERLPSERELADKLGVSRPSLREAIGELAEAGLLVSRAGSGVFVAEVLGSAFSPALVKLFDAQTGEQIPTSRMGHSFPDRGTNAVVFTPDGASLFTIGNDRTLMSWDVATGLVRRNFADNFNFAGQGSRLHALAISTDGSLIAFGGEDETVDVVDDTGRLVRRFVQDDQVNAVSIQAVAFSPDGQLLLSTEGMTAYLQPIFLP